MSNHTPGPWMHTPTVDYKNSASGTHGFLILQGQRTNAKNIATVVPCIGMTKDEVEANAKLIANAPRMRALLAQARRYYLYEINEDGEPKPPVAELLKFWEEVNSIL